jgi:Ca-activated chloride channel family protein
MRHPLTPFLAFVFAFAVQASAFDESTPIARREGAGFELPAGVDASVLPLVSQTSTVDIAGVVARIRIEQVWRNSGKTAIEASYVFPTSTRAALHDLRLQIGEERELRAEIHAKEEATKLFEAARDAGKTAGLLEQQRPNVVTMKVTNVMPGETIRVTIEASEVVRSTDGVYELVLPQTVGPRYLGAGNGGSEAFVDNGFIASAASKVVTRIGVTLRSPIGIKSVGSPSHAMAPQFDGRSEARIHIDSSAEDVVADRDVVLRWKLASDQPETGVLLFRDKERGEHFFLLLGEPPAHVDAKQTPPREVIFVVDVSGSMHGFPLDTAKTLLRELVGELRPTDRFNMMFFSGGSHVFEPEGSVDANRSNVQRALDALDKQSGGGGTELSQATKTALALPRGKADGVERARTIVVVTDGFIGAERAAFDLVREARGDAAVFAFGIGSSVNRHLIEGLAAAGGTEPFVMLDAAQAARAVQHFRTVARPALTNVNVRFDGFAVSDLEPPAPPDLYAGRPLVMLGRFTGASSGTVVVTGDAIGNKEYRNVITVEDNLERPSHAPLRELWARERIARLADRGTPSAADTKEVERLGLRYRLLTERTSFVVVDPTVRNTTGTRTDAKQPSVGARGVDFSDVSIEGQLAQPQGTYLESRAKTKNRSLVQGIIEEGPRAGSNGTSGGFGAGVGSAGLGTTGVGRGGGGSGLADRDMTLGRGKSMTRIVPGKIVYEGGMSREEIQRVMSRHMAQIKYCYEKQLAKVPGLSGKLVLSWVIKGDGTVEKVTVTSNSIAGSAGTDVGTCATKMLARMKFPAPKGGGVVNVTYPFVFSQSE